MNKSHLFPNQSLLVGRFCCLLFSYCIVNVFVHHDNDDDDDDDGGIIDCH